MKILLVSHFFPPQRTAGAEKITQSYALELLKKGHEVQVVCAGEWESGEKYWNGYVDETYLGIPVRRFNLNWAAAPDPNRFLYDNPLLEAQFDAWLQEWKPDVVHLVSILTVATGAVRAIKRAGIPIVFTLVDFWLVCPKINLVRGDGGLCDGKVSSAQCVRCLFENTSAYKKLSRFLPPALVSAGMGWAGSLPALGRLRGLRGYALNVAARRKRIAEIARLIDFAAAPSNFLGRTINANAIFPRPIPVIPYGHDLTWRATMPPKSRSERIRFGYIGQIIPLKGIHLLIKAFQAAEAGQRGASLFIHGNAQADPAYTEKLKAMLRPGDEIHFMGPYPHQKLGEVLAGLDMVVTPSQWHENNPLVIQEAFAGKTPVIASDVGGISEFIQPGVNGFLFKHDQAADLSRQIGRVLDDPGWIGRLQAGIPPVKTITEEVNEYIAVYRELIHKASAGARGTGAA